MNKLTFIIILTLIGTAFAIENRCYYELDTGPCRNLKFRYGFNPNKSKCEQFVYGGCEGNGNNFANETECMDVCGYKPPTTSTSTTTSTSPSPSQSPKKGYESLACRGWQHRRRTFKRSITNPMDKLAPWDKSSGVA